MDKSIELNTKNDVLETEFNKLITENDEMCVKRDEIKEIKSNDVNNEKLNLITKNFGNINYNQILISILFFAIIILYLQLK